MINIFIFRRYKIGTNGGIRVASTASVSQFMAETRKLKWVMTCA